MMHTPDGERDFQPIRGEWLGIFRVLRVAIAAV
jgi:hypothetical protein